MWGNNDADMAKQLLKIESPFFGSSNLTQRKISKITTEISCSFFFRKRKALGVTAG
jgi:hypothetical protein